VALLEETRAVAKSYLGDVAAAKLGLERAEVLGAERSSPRVRSRIASFRGTLAFRTGDLAGADAAYRKAHALALAHDLADHLAIAALNRGTVSHRLGDFGDALASYDEALSLARALGKHRTEITARYDRTQLRCDLGLFERVRAEATELEERARSLGIDGFVALARMVRGEAALHAGDGASAERDFDVCRTMLAKAASRRELGDLELLAAELHLRSNRADEAAASLERARAELAAADAADIQTRESLLRARLALARGDAKSAVSLLAQAAKRAHASGERDLEAEIEALAAEAAAAQRAHDAAARHARSARELWDDCAATVDVSLRDSFFLHPRRRMVERFEAPQERASGARERLLERLLSINARLNATLDVRAILEAAMDAAIEITEAERCFVILAGDTGLEVAASRNIDRERVDRDYLKFSRTIAERVIETGEPMITTDAFSDSRFTEQRSIQSMRLRSVIGVPIRGRERVLGALYLDNRFAPGRFAETQVRELLGFADQVAIALGNARLVRELEERTRELETERARIRSNLETKTLEVDRLHREIALTRRALGDRFGRGAILGRSAAMRALFEALDRVADTKMTVLITGESGSGKELVARAIHAGATTPFVGINCAALPENLLESELFGHVRGAFTGADRDRDGLFVLAGEGTLFLDEIGELALGMQAKLLRALQEREIRPVGSPKSIPIDARIVCATNRDLRAEIAAGRFREDLYYRIAVMELRVPPLRDRVDDLPELAAHILAQAANETGAGEPKRLSADALRVLARHRWPGNVRELENALRRAHVMSPGREIGAGDLALESATDAPSSYADFERREAAELAALLESARWNVAEVARRAGMSRTTLYRKLRQYRLERKGAAPS
jgi:transcriptional regulator with GAF, ATPase, and Fis domain